MRRVLPLAAAPVLGAAALIGYGAGYEVRAFRLRQVEVPALRGDPGLGPLRVLHLSDLHLTPARAETVAWVRDLARLVPDLVVVTGDLLAAADAVPTVLEALEPLATVGAPAVFVPGNNDYQAPIPRNPLRYLAGPSTPGGGAALPWGALAGALVERGWVDLTHRRATLRVAGRAVELVGVDDPHLRRDRYSRVAGPVDPAAALAIGVLHTPARRVLDAMTADGTDLLLAGHTHGGQVRLPGIGALVTNCDLDRARARGLSRWPDRARGPAWLHVSAGLGTSPYAPVRIGCRPEATLLTVTPVG